MDYHYLFGPVPSRRVGRSLGVDLVPSKTCSFDCPFCEVGRTTSETTRRAEYVPTDVVIEELRHWLEHDGEADVITLAGSGEPTLHSHFGDIIEAIQAACDIPVVLLTNSSLLHLADVREAAARAAIVKGSLSAWDDRSFKRVNRPASDLDLETVVAGLREFRACFGCQFWIEVFLMRGINDAPGDVAKIAALVESIAPDLVQLNTVVRPPAYQAAEAISPRELEHLAPLFKPKAEIIARFQAGDAVKESSVDRSHIQAMLSRRPCTIDDIAGAFAISAVQAEALVEDLLATSSIASINRPDGTYYALSTNHE